MGRLTSSKGQGSSKLAVLVASCLLLATVGDAFVSYVSVSSVTTPTTPKPTWEVKAAQPTNRGLATQNTQVSLFKAVASVALLCLAASRVSTKTSKSSIRCVVGMTAPSTVTSTVTIPKATEMEDLLQFEDQPAATNVISEAPAVTAKTAMSAAPEIESEPTAATATGKTFCGARARFAAGARRSHHHHSRTASGRAARRAVGQQLIEACAVHQPTPSETFDASKTRTKIQLGLRVSSCMRSESGRESKVSSGVEGSEMGTCLNFVAHDLKVYMLDHESALNDAIHSHLGNLAHSAIL